VALARRSRCAVVAAAAIGVLAADPWLGAFADAAPLDDVGQEVAGCDDNSLCVAGPMPGSIPWQSAGKSLQDATITCFQNGNGWKSSGEGPGGPTGKRPWCDAGDRYEIAGWQVFGLHATDALDKSRQITGGWLYGCLENDSQFKTIGTGATPTESTGWHLDSWGLLPEPNAFKTQRPDSTYPDFEVYALQELFFVRPEEESIGWEKHTVYAKWGHKTRPILAPAVWRVNVTLDVHLTDESDGGRDVWVQLPLSQEIPKMVSLNGSEFQVATGWDEDYVMTQDEGRTFCEWTS
jgi:hypothetical protein